MKKLLIFTHPSGMCGLSFGVENGKIVSITAYMDQWRGYSTNELTSLFSGAGLTVAVGYDITGGMTYGLSQIW